MVQVPPAWLKAYPSLKALGPWTRDLLQRLDQLKHWIDKGYPTCYWLAGFTYPTAFLTAVLQVHINTYTCSTPDRLDFVHNVMLAVAAALLSTTSEHLY